MIYKGQKLSDNLTKSQRDMFKYMIDRGDSVDTIITVILGFIALMVWAIGDKLSQK